MSVRVSPAAAMTSTTTLPSFAQSFDSTASASLPMRPTNPVREAHRALPAAAAAQALAPEPAATTSARKRPRRGSHGAAASGSESPRPVLVKEEVDELADAADVRRPLSLTIGHDPSTQEPPPQPHQAKKRRTARLNTDLGDRPSAASTPVSPAVHASSSSDAHKDKLVHFPQSITNGSSPRSAAATASGRRSAHLSSPPTPMAAPQLSSISQALAAPPGSFASRRGVGNGARRKPADLLLNHDVKTSAPVIQSAPAVPRGDVLPGRFPTMEVPTLPPMLTLQSVRHPPGRVPPTPNRPGTHRAASGPSLMPPSLSATSRVGRSSPTVPIAVSTIPPTPTVLRNPNGTAEKAAFLGPFETFYDALADAKDLKTWLHDNVQRAAGLAASLERQQQNMDEIIRAAVDRAVAPMRDEVRRLRERVAECEAGQRGPARPPNRSGHGSPAEAYAAPPRPMMVRHPSSPALASTGTASPAPYDARRQPTSAMRTTTDASRQLVPLTTLSAARDRHEAAYHDSPHYGHSHESVPISRHHSGYGADEREHGHDRSRSRSPPRRARTSPSPGLNQSHSRSPGG